MVLRQYTYAYIITIPPPPRKCGYGLFEHVGEAAALFVALYTLFTVVLAIAPIAPVLPVKMVLGISEMFGVKMYSANEL